MKAQLFIVHPNRETGFSPDIDPYEDRAARVLEKFIIMWPDAEYYIYDPALPVGSQIVDLKSKEETLAFFLNTKEWAKQRHEAGECECNTTPQQFVTER